MIGRRHGSNEIAPAREAAVLLETLIVGVVFIVLIPLLAIHRTTDFMIFCIFAIYISRSACRASSQMMRGFTVEAPSFAIPDRHRGRTRRDGTEIRTVRLPERCPSCGGSLTHEDIDWTGPLEARCNYCGGTVRATFESI